MFFTLSVTVGLTGSEWIEYFGESNISINARTLLQSADFCSTVGTKYKIGILLPQKNEDVFVLMKKAQEFGWLDKEQVISAEVACYIADDPILCKTMMRKSIHCISVMHQPIINNLREPMHFGVIIDQQNIKLGANCGYPSSFYGIRNIAFAFVVSQE